MSDDLDLVPSASGAYLQPSGPVYFLICEGRCNEPWIGELKRLEAAWAGKDQLLSGQASALRRRLMHQTHVMVAGDAARCTVCGHTRSYGGDRRRVVP